MNCRPKRALNIAMLIDTTITIQFTTFITVIICSAAISAAKYNISGFYKNCAYNDNTEYDVIIRIVPQHSFS